MTLACQNWTTKMKRWFRNNEITTEDAKNLDNQLVVMEKPRRMNEWTLLRRYALSTSSPPFLFSTLVSSISMHLTATRNSRCSERSLAIHIIRELDSGNCVSTDTRVRVFEARAAAVDGRQLASHNSVFRFPLPRPPRPPRVDISRISLPTSGTSFPISRESSLRDESRRSDFRNRSRTTKTKSSVSFGDRKFPTCVDIP